MTRAEARTPEQWRLYVDALVEDVYEITGLYKAALKVITEAHDKEWKAERELADQMREYDALREERDELADQCADLGARVRELEAQLEQVCKDFNDAQRGQ